MGVELRVVRHEAFAEGAESIGDLIIFDIDKSNVMSHRSNANTKVFCQDPSKYKILPYAELSADFKAAVDRMFQLQFVAEEMIA